MQKGAGQEQLWQINLQPIAFASKSWHLFPVALLFRRVSFFFLVSIASIWNVLFVQQSISNIWFRVILKMSFWLTDRDLTFLLLGLNRTCMKCHTSHLLKSNERFSAISHTRNTTETFVFQEKFLTWSWQFHCQLSIWTLMYILFV